MASPLPERPQATPDVEALTRLAVERYDFDSLRSDIGDIIDIPSAIARIGAWAIGLPIAVSVLTWLLFQSRFGAAGLFLFIVVVALLAAIAGVAAGVAIVTRRRVDKTSAAAAKIVEITGMVHGDYEQAREGAARVSMRSVGVLAAREIVLPTLFGAAGRTALLGGPLGWLIRPLIGIVETKVTRALSELPDSPLALPAGTDSATSPAQPPDTTAATTEVVAAEVARVQDLPAEALTADDMDVRPQAVDDAYGDIQQRFEQIVGKIGGVAITSSSLLLVVATVPLLIVLVLGWLAT